MRKTNRFKIRYVFITIFIILILACAVLVRYITARNQYKAAVLSAQTVNNLKEHGSIDMSAEIDFSLEGEISNVLGFLGLNLGDIALTADNSTLLSIKETQDPFAIHYEGDTNFTLFEQTISLPLNGYVSLEDGKAYNYNQFGDYWQKEELDEALYTTGSYAEGTADMDKLDWYKTMLGLFYAVLSEEVVVDLEDTPVTMNGTECYVMHFMLTQEQLDSIIEAAFPADQVSDTLSYLNFDEAVWDKIDPSIILYVSTEDKLPVHADIDIGTVENIVLGKNISDNQLMQLIGGITVVIENLEMSIDFNNYGTVQEIIVPAEAQ